MRTATREDWLRWINENPKATIDYATICEPACITYTLDGQLMARAYLGDPVTYELSESAKFCDHTFGQADGCDERWLVEGKKDFIRYSQPNYPGAKPYLQPDDYFTYCPDCGVPLAPIIAEIKAK